MIQEFLEFANEVKELDKTCKELIHTNHMLRVKINGLKLKLKENGIETDDTELTPSKQVLGYIEGLLDSKDWDENDPVFKTLLKIQEYIRPIV